MTTSPSESRIPRDARGVAAQGEWGWGVAVYLALLAAGTGAWLVWLLASVFDASWVDAGRSGAALGIVTVAAGALVVLFDLGRRARFWRAAARPRASWESRASLLIVTFVGFAILEQGGRALEWPGSRWLALPAVACAVVLLLYAALLLRGMRAYPLWRHPLQLLLVPAGGLAAGCTLLAVDPTGTLSAAQLRALAIGVAVFAAVEALALAIVLRQVHGAGAAGAASVDALVSGPHARRFWWGAAGAGVVVPGLIGALVAAGWIDAASLRVAAVAATVGLAMLRERVLVAAHRSAALTFGGGGPWDPARSPQGRP